MCGIAGFVTSNPAWIDSTIMRDLPSSLSHRGPDDSGYLVFDRGRVRTGKRWDGAEVDAEAVLFHERLSIIDLTDAGWQPMQGCDGRYYIVFNGEIYNYLELRQELEALGHRFQSRSDTEVLLAAHAEWGAGALNRFVGMFAFALLDTVGRKVILARDCFGIKPLYFATAKGSFAFASEIKALLQIPWISRRADAGQTFLYLRHGVTDNSSNTMFEDVKQLPPAHYMEIALDDPSQIRFVRYWEIDTEHQSDLSFDDAVKRVRDLFLENVTLHLRSDVPLGVALSGGIDSSAIAMTVRHLYGSGAELHTFSYIAEEKAISEESWVDVVGRASGAVEHKVTVNSDDLSRDVGRVVRAQDEPFRSTSMYAQYCVYRLAREAGIKVMLDGQGADELLGGYTFHLAARFASLWRGKKYGAGARFLKGVGALPHANSFWTWAEGMSYILPQGLQGPVRRLVGRDLTPGWLNMEWFAARMESTPPAGVKRRPQGELRQKLFDDVTKLSLPHLLRYGDRNSMAFGVESRLPFLTPSFAQFLFTLPEEYLIGRDGTSKLVFRAAMKGIVPDAVLQRKGKLGFNTPETKWLVQMKPWVDRVLRDVDSSSVAPLRMSHIRREWESIQKKPHLFDYRLWRWCNFIEWSQQNAIAFD
jgi:asparagine synthase (glutamine-hydrolysing)